MGICSRDGQRLWTNTTVAAQSELAMGTLGNRDRVFCLGLGSAENITPVLSALDAFWIYDECRRDANRSWRCFLCSYFSLWDRLSTAWKRPNAS